MKIILFLILVFVLYYFINKFILSKFKLPKFGAITVFTGGVKKGKTAISLYCALSQYKRNLRRWKVRTFFTRILNFFFKNKYQYEEKPLFYSNIPLRNMEYCALTTNHLLRKYRFNYKSVVFLDEASLVADSMLIKDKTVNTELLLFCKLFGHSTKGGNLFINSHCISDLHYAIKRCTSDYFYIHNLSNWLLFNVAKCREERFSEDGTDLNVYDEDIEKSLVSIIMFRNIFKKYDCYCYSEFTDNLPRLNNLRYKTKYDSLKTTDIPSFRYEFSILGGNNTNEEKK